MPESSKVDCMHKRIFMYCIFVDRQILSHTSGLPREVPCGPSFSSEHGNICPVNTTYVYETLKNTKLKFAPGTSVGYR
jgi:CubicO group peptidase (beta-lactamase class C family)